MSAFGAWHKVSPNKYLLTSTMPNQMTKMSFMLPAAEALFYTNAIAAMGYSSTAEYVRCLFIRAILSDMAAQRATSKP
jgi:hypothetical protein